MGKDITSIVIIFCKMITTNSRIFIKIDISNATYFSRRSVSAGNLKMYVLCINFAN